MLFLDSPEEYWFYNLGDVYVSVMAQYFPTYKAKDVEKLNRKISIKEYKEII